MQRTLTKISEKILPLLPAGSRGERIKAAGAVVNGEKVMPKVVDPNNTDFKADLVIFTVKNYQLENALADVKNIVADNTILLTILNGVWARDRIKEEFPNNTVLYGLSKTDAARTEQGVECTWEGQIQFGEADNTVMSEEVSAVKSLFDEAEIDSLVCEDMLRAVWVKFMINVSVNQLSAVTHAGYGAFLNIPYLNKAMHEVMTEVITLANAMGINISETDADAHEKTMDKSDPYGQTSMLQDIEAKRKTEVEYFSGTVIRLGKQYNVPTPWNDRLYMLIKTMENLY